jgi:hypothetical protein
VLALDSGQSWASMELPLHWDDHDNVPGITCIPAGTYTVEDSFSEHFQRNVPHVMGVSGRTDIEIHPASRPCEIKGCIAIGQIENLNPTESDDVVLTMSRESFFNEFYPLFKAALEHGEVVSITITNEFSAMSA